MKILFFARRFYPDVGGVETHVYEIGKRLIQMGHQVTVVSEMPGSSQSRMSDKLTGELDGIRILRIPTGENERRKKFTIWKWLWEHRGVMREADVIHCHDVFFWFLPFTILYPRKQVYTTFHGYEGYPIRRKAIIYRKIFELLSKGSICVGDFMKKWYHAKPDYVIYGGVSLQVKESLKKKRDAAIFIGRLDDQTGIDTYVQAVKNIRKNYIPNFTLTLYGDGPYRKTAETEEGVIIKGFTPSASEHIPFFYYSFISRYLAILEALIHKSPVIAVYDDPVKRDYLQMAPFADFIFIVRNENEIIQTIKEINLNPNRANKMVEKGFEWASKQTWEEVVKVYLALWKK